VRNFVVLVCLCSFATGIAVIHSGLPSQSLISRLQTQIQVRFKDTLKGNFGVSRLGEPYQSHRPLYSRMTQNRKMLPENPEEMAILDSLNAAGWDVVAFTASKGMMKHAHQDRVTKQIIVDGPPTEIARANGPVKIAGKDRKDFSTGAIYEGLDHEALAAINSGKESVQFQYGAWEFVTQRVHAQAECLSCHESKLGHKIKLGDTIGIYMLGFKRS
jgi:hypothetical protein